MVFIVEDCLYIDNYIFLVVCGVDMSEKTPNKLPTNKYSHSAEQYQS